MKENKLDCVFSSDISFPKGIRGIRNGKFEMAKQVSANEVENDPIPFDFIQELHIEKFRKSPKQDKFEFGKVNLIERPNGTGKTTLLEAIELFTCGSNYRNKGVVNDSWSVKAKFRNQQEFRDIILNNNKLYRYRDRLWYNRTTYERKSKLDQSFKKFNFYNTDAAVELALQQSNESELLEPLEQITLGPEINFLNSRIIKYDDELSKINKSNKKKLDNLRIEIKQEKMILKKLQKQGDNSEILFERLMKHTKQLNWRGYLLKNLNSQTERFESEIQKISDSLFQLIRNMYWLDRISLDKLEKAKKTGASIVGMDIDASGLITLKLMGRPVIPRPPEKLRKIIEATSMKFILKGIMTPGDAKLAVDVGASGIVVSNHGGRVLDYTPGVAEVLPNISKAVGGQIAIMADGGIRSGGDVLKMLALGADAVMIGRPFSVAAIGGLQEGVEKYIDEIKSELIQSMILTGCNDISSIDKAILFDAST